MKIIAFAHGDPFDPNTWSNVPFYSVLALQNMGHQVIGIDLGGCAEKRRVVFWIDRFIKLFLGRNTQCLLEHSRFMGRKYKTIISKAVQENPDASLLVFYTYSASGCHDYPIPSLMLCDFTIDYAITQMMKREYRFWEKRYFSIQDELIKETDYFACLFPQVADYYKDYYHRDVISLQGHVINTNKTIDDIESIIGGKRRSNNILFIGRKKYLMGLRTLISAVQRFNNNNVSVRFRITVIGMNGKEGRGLKQDGVTYLGYLDKTKASQRKQYYDAIMESKLIVNTTKGWAGISSVVEAMYFGTPIITTNYPEFYRVFGEIWDCGRYCLPEDVDDLEKALASVSQLDEQAYSSMCYSAHNRVCDFTWDRAMRDILEATGVQS